MAITTENDQSLYVENIDYGILTESESDFEFTSPILLESDQVLFIENLDYPVLAEDGTESYPSTDTELILGVSLEE